MKPEPRFNASVSILICLTWGLCCSGQVDWPQITLTQIGTGFVEPVYVASARDGSDRLFVVEQIGRIQIIQSNSILPQPFLDISNRVSNPPGSVYGLLSVAFPPGFATSQCFYVYYSRTNDQATVISRFHVGPGPNQADVASEQILLTIPLGPCPPGVLGGQLAFSPDDGYLYISTGDEGSCGDPSLAQTPDSWWGKLFRIDVSGGTNGYAVPPSNPFVNSPPYLPEMWALGLRNPWRFSFDRATGSMLIGDVGQNLLEEIDYQPPSSVGGINYGWAVMEGTDFVGGETLWDTNNFTLPVFEYPHTNRFGSSVTGGFVYRGPHAARMDGLYFFGDFITGDLWALSHQGSNWLVQSLPVPAHFISSFGEDDAGRLYLADFVFGKVYRIDDSGLTGPPVFSPSGGTVNTDQIMVSCSSPGADIHYTTNGATPTENDPVVGGDGIVVVQTGATLSARSYRSDLQPSVVTSTLYTLKVGTPMLSPAHGPVTNGTSVSIQSSTPGASIRYTLDGTDPTTNSLLYSGSFPINSSNVLSARGFKEGFADSSVARVYFSGAMNLTNVVSLSGAFLNFNWASEIGRTYQVQTSTNLLDWQDIGENQSGTGTVLGYSAAMSGKARFYRLRIY